MTAKQKGFSAVAVLLVIVILAVIGATGWYVWHSKRVSDTALKPADKNAAPAADDKTAVSRGAAPVVPAGWQTYTGQGFVVAYPAGYGAMTPYNATAQDQVADNVQGMWTAAAPATPLFDGLHGLFSLTKYTTQDAAISARKYGPAVTYKNGLWKVVSDNPGDPTPYKTGATYTEVTKTVVGGLPVFTFKSGDEGAIEYTEAFIVNSHLYTLQLPEFDTGTYSGPAHDQKPYDQLADQVVRAVSLK